jgi:hypothetical protein
MSPLPLDEHRVTKLAEIAEAIEEGPRGPGWKARKNAAYAALARACDTACANVLATSGSQHEGAGR